MFEINLIRNHLSTLIERKKNLMNILDYNTKKANFREIKKKLENSNIWNNPQQAQKLSKDCFFLKKTLDTLDQLTNEIKDISNLFELAIEVNDSKIFNEIIIEIHELEKQLTRFEFNSIFSREYDNANCYIDIQAGSGGTEAQDWAKMLMRMYLRWADLHKFRTEIIEESEGEIAGIKSVTIKINGDYAYGWLRTETGIHRLVRKSPFDSNRRRHTSFSSAFIYPEVDENIDIKINLADLRIDVYRASGAGGQHVNRTESAVRITHIPTGLVTQCQSDRSQHKNKDQAIKQMKAKLYKLEMQKKNIQKQKIENDKSNIGWGNQIRSYIIDNSLIKDLRTGIETRNVQEVLDGYLDQFIEASLKLGL